MIIARVRRQRLAVHPTRRILAESIRWYRDNILLKGFRDISLNHRFVLVTLLDNRWQFKIKWTPSIKFQMEGQGRSTCLSASDRGLWKWTGRLGSQLAKTRGAYHLTEKSGWGVESIMVSDLPVYRRIATSVTVWIQKGANLCSVSLELRKNREICKW